MKNHSPVSQDFDFVYPFQLCLLVRQLHDTFPLHVLSLDIEPNKDKQKKPLHKGAFGLLT